MNEDKKTTNNIEEEVNWKKVLSNPIRWFGFVYPMFIVAVIAGGFYYIDNMSAMVRNKVDNVFVQYPDSMIKITSKKASIQEGVNIEEIAIPNDAIIAQGKEIYLSNCASCHGNEGAGDGIAGNTLNPKPRNFTSKDGWVNGTTISGMFKTLEEGIAGGGMVAYEYLPVRDRFALIHFIRQSFLGDNAEKSSDEELQELDITYQLSQGKKTSNQIPVDIAIQRIVDEEIIRANKIENFNKYLADNSSSEGAMIFSKLIKHPQLAVISLLSNNNWNSAEDMMKLIASTYPHNGFNAGVNTLSVAKAESLYSFMKSSGIFSTQVAIAVDQK